MKYEFHPDKTGWDSPEYKNPCNLMGNYQITRIFLFVNIRPE